MTLSGTRGFDEGSAQLARPLRLRAFGAPLRVHGFSFFGFSID